MDEELSLEESFTKYRPNCLSHALMINWECVFLGNLFDAECANVVLTFSK
jgi:hypothetical protein